MDPEAGDALVDVLADGAELAFHDPQSRRVRLPRTSPKISGQSEGASSTSISA